MQKPSRDVFEIISRSRDVGDELEGNGTACLTRFDGIHSEIKLLQGRKIFDTLFPKILFVEYVLRPKTTA